MITDDDRIIKVNIEEEMKSSYIDYSMSVSYRVHCPMCAMDLSLSIDAYYTT